MQKNYYTVCKSSAENLPYFLMRKIGKKYKFIQLNNGSADILTEIQNDFNERTGYRIAGHTKPIIVKQDSIKQIYYFATIRVEPEYLDFLKFEAPLLWVRYDIFNEDNTDKKDLEALRKEFKKSGWAKYFKKNGLTKNSNSAEGDERNNQTGN